MRKLTSKQLVRLRDIGTVLLEMPKLGWHPLGIAPEDLLVACDVALGGAMLVGEDERRALVETYHQQCADAWRHRRGAQIGQTQAHWPMRGFPWVRFSASFLSERSKSDRKVNVDLNVREIHEEASRLRKDPASPWISFPEDIQRGKGWQKVEIRVPREMLLGIADDLEGSVDTDDAEHRFYHWQNPKTPRPCSSCRKAADVNPARTQLVSTWAAARTQLVSTWAATLGVPIETVERLLSEFNGLPRKVYESWHDTH